MSEQRNKLLRAQRQDRPIVQREEDGQYQIGWQDDAPGPFATRSWAQAVANHRATGDPPKRRRPRRANPRPLINRWDRAAATHTYAEPELLSSPALRSPGVLAGWYAVTADSLVLGTFKSRLEAAQASGRCA